MATLSNTVLFVLLTLLAQHWARPAQAQPAGQAFLSCPPGWIVSSQRGGPGRVCSLDPCNGNPCGPGNTCAALQNPFTAVTRCTCNAPYKTGVVPSLDRNPEYTVCYLPGQDVCNPSPCLNGGICSYIQPNSEQFLTDDQGIRFAFRCDCSNTGRTGTICTDTIQDAPGVTATVNGVSGPLASADIRACNTPIPSLGCYYADLVRFTCCPLATSCGPLGPDGVPICPVPRAAPTGDQGVCGSGAASDFPTRCYFNNDPQGRYVCCDLSGCNGFNSDNLTPRCFGNGYVPPNNGLGAGPTPPSTPPSTPPGESQGVCGSGAASDFPTRCPFNNDPQRYVCCDREGCNGFNPNLRPRCRNNGYVPPNDGLAGPSPPSTPPSTPPSGSQGVCGTGVAKDFPLRCWFNNDPQGRYVCCDNDGCNGFNPPDNSFPRCKTNGYVPPGFGV